MPLQNRNPDRFRPCTGVVIFNAKGQVWLGKRAGQTGNYVWQFPQGGIDQGETSEYAAIRETEEETGISVQHLAPLGKISEELYYEYPADVRVTPRTKLWAGQRQTWFAFRFTGSAGDVNLTAHQPPEFSDWRWGTLADTPSLIIPFKRPVYERLASEFEHFAKPLN